MDVTTLGALIALVGVLATAVVTYLGKRGDSALARFDSVTNQVQEERDGLQRQVTELRAENAALYGQRTADLKEINRLTRKILDLGGEP